VKAREYSGPLGILAAGALGLSLLCSVSAMAMGDLNRYIPITIEPLNIVDLAVSNLETAAAFTEQVVTQFVPTATVTPITPTGTASLTPQPTDTQRRFVTITPTVTRKPRTPPTATHFVPSQTATTVPSRVPTNTPSRTPIPTWTNTPIPTSTDTPVPPTNTSIPPTDTVVPPTDTSVPPTDTSVPATDTANPATQQIGSGSEATTTPGP
jgi:hypothetical protein